jgi:hypothetical protein
VTWNKVQGCTAIAIIAAVILEVRAAQEEEAEEAEEEEDNYLYRVLSPCRASVPLSVIASDCPCARKTSLWCFYSSVKAVTVTTSATTNSSAGLT